MKFTSIMVFVGCLVLVTVASVTWPVSKEAFRALSDDSGSSRLSNVAIADGIRRKILPFPRNFNLTKPDEKPLAKASLKFDGNVPKLHRDFINKAYDGAIMLANAAVQGLNENDLVAFQRYFRDSDAEFVKAVFAAFVEAAMDSSGSKIRDVLITLGDVEGEKYGCNSPGNPLAYIAKRDTKDQFFEPGSTIHICLNFFSRNYFPGTVDCDYVKKNWKRITWFQDSAASHFLHEWMHYSDIVMSANGDVHAADQLIYKPATLEQHQTYGPYYTNIYRDAAITTPRNNADNFVWYAIEQYWRIQCGHHFEPAIRDEDYVKHPDATDAEDPDTISSSRAHSKVAIDKDVPRELSSTLPHLNLTRSNEKIIAKVPLNFDTKVEPNQREFISKAYDDAILLAQAGVHGFDGSDQGIFLRYFQDSDAPFVRAVLQTFIDAAMDPSHTSKIRDVTVTVGDTQGMPRGCFLPKPPILYIMSAPDKRGYYGPGSSIHVCRAFWKHEKFLQDITCDEVRKYGEKMSWLMDCAGSFFLHEWTHYSDLTLSANGNLPIADIKIEIDGREQAIYGPYLATKYRDISRAPRLNADNFAFYILEQYWTTRCNHKFQPPTLDNDGPPDPVDAQVPVTAPSQTSSESISDDGTSSTGSPNLSEIAIDDNVEDNLPSFLEDFHRTNRQNSPSEF